MSLQIKFLLLVGTLLLSVAGSVTAAGWTLGFVHREIATPFDQLSIALGELGKIKRAIEETAMAIGPAPGGAATEIAPSGVRDPASWLPPRTPTAENRLAVSTAAASARTHVETLEQNEWYVSRIGISLWANIINRLNAVTRGSQAWLDSGDEPARAAARREAFDLHELIEKTELRLLEDARKSVGFSDDLRTLLGWFLSAVFLAAALISGLGVVLLRRWVHRPVKQLREAAAHIASGDFGHRVTVEARDELGLLMSEVNHMAGMVDQYQREAIDRERLAAVGQMVRRIVHNVRNPLAGIRGLAEVTRMDAPEGSEQRDNLSLIVSTVDTFERWLGQLLESTHPMNIHPVSTPLADWVTRIVQSHEAGARAKSVRLVIDAGDSAAHAEIDPRHLEHALAAVVANAIDTSTAGQSVHVRVMPVELGEFYEISVSDQGPGVPDSLRERIFEPHFTTKSHGTGIGLALARQILRSHGGSITIDPAQNAGSGAQGASFRLRVPRIAKKVTGQVAVSSHQTG